MRYFFLQALTMALLTQGIVVFSPATLLVFLGGAFKGFGAGFYSTTIRAIPVTAITATADDHLRMATQAVEQSAGIRHRQKRPMRTGFIPSLEQHLEGRATGAVW